jgi:hypothetical protein
MRTLLRAAFIAPVATLLLAPAARATVADDLCNPLDDPCIVSTQVTVDPGSTLDFGGRTFRIAVGASLTWSDDLTIDAGACDFEPGSKLVEDKHSPGTGFLRLNCDSSTLAGDVGTNGAGVLVEGDGPHLLSGKLKAKGDQVGVIAIDSYGLPGDITVTGKMQAKSTVGTPPGEFRLESNFGDIAIGEKARIKMRGVTADPFTEFFIVVAGTGSLTIDGKVDGRAKTGAYAWNLEANGDVVFGPKSKILAKGKETGPEIAINSQGGSVTLRGKILAKASNAGSSDGSKVGICAGNDILVDAKASIDTSTSGSGDGSIILGAFDVARVGTVSVGAKLLSKTDGDIEVCGGTSGSISNSSKVIPDPEAVGTTGDCLSPESGLIFELDCSS